MATCKSLHACLLLQRVKQKRHGAAADLCYSEEVAFGISPQIKEEALVASPHNLTSSLGLCDGWR